MKSKKSLIIILILVVISLFVLVAYKRNTKFELPKYLEIEGIGLELDGVKKTISSRSDIKELVEELESITSGMFSNLDNSKIKKEKPLIVNFYDSSKNTLTIHLYNEEDNYYLETKKGINLIKKENYEEIANYLKDNYVNFNKFYNAEIVQNYKRIDELDNNYKIDDTKDLVLGFSKVYNKELLSKFMDNYQNNKSCFIRIIQSTVEGDVIIYDVKYDSKIDKLIILYDSTRDKLIKEEKRIIQKYEYEKIALYDYNKDTYLVAYDGKINDGTLYSDNSLILGIVKK